MYTIPRALFIDSYFPILFQSTGRKVRWGSNDGAPTEEELADIHLMLKNKAKAKAAKARKNENPDSPMVGKKRGKDDASSTDTDEEDISSGGTTIEIRLNTTSVGAKNGTHVNE